MNSPSDQITKEQLADLRATLNRAADCGIVPPLPDWYNALDVVDRGAVVVALPKSASEAE